MQGLNQVFPNPNEDAVRTLAGLATVRLREAILGGRLPPGTRLSQDTLARQLGVSRVPLREALQILAAEGLVEWRAHRAAVVTGLSAHDLEELYVLGANIEAAAVAQACVLATDEHIRAIGNLLEVMAKADIEPAEWHATNREFHTMLVGPANWNRFERIISEVRANTGRYSKAYLELSGNIHSWRKDHEEIYQCYRDRDPAGSAVAVRRHWMKTSEALQKHLKSGPKNEI